MVWLEYIPSVYQPVQQKIRHTPLLNIHELSLMGVGQCRGTDWLEEMAHISFLLCIPALLCENVVKDLVVQNKLQCYNKQWLKLSFLYRYTCTLCVQCICTLTVTCKNYIELVPSYSWQKNVI